MRILPHENLVQGIKDVHAEAQGIISVLPIRPVDMIEFLGAAMAGDDDAQEIIKACAQFIRKVESESARMPLLCVSCPSVLMESGYSFVLAASMQDGPKKALIMGVCPKCGKTKKEISNRAITHLRKIWPDLRPVTHPEGGRA